MPEKTPEESMITMTEIVLPQHTNARGTVFGGVVLSWVDIAAASCALKHTNKGVVTASIDGMHFLAPIKLGWIVTIRASVNATWKTSLEVGVRVDAENPLTLEKNHTSSAYVTMVALDSHDKPIEINAIKPMSDIQKKRHSQALERRKVRLELKKRFENHGQ